MPQVSGTRGYCCCNMAAERSLQVASNRALHLTTKLFAWHGIQALYAANMAPFINRSAGQAQYFKKLSLGVGIIILDIPGTR